MKLTTRVMAGKFYMDLVGDLFARQQSVLLTPEPLRTLAYAAAMEHASAQQSSTQDRVTIFVAKSRHWSDWQQALDQLDSSPAPVEKASFTWSSYRAFWSTAYQLDPHHAVLLDARGLTRDSSTTLWRHLAPQLRAHAGPLTLLVGENDWPQAYVQAELVGPLDKVLVHASELEYRRSERAS